MRKCFFTVVFLAFCPLLVAQQALNNDSIIKLVKAGLSEDLIVTTINAAPGTYDISADGLIALKTAGATDKVVAAIVAKAAAPAPAGTAPGPPPAPMAATVDQTAAPVPTAPATPSAVPAPGLVQSSGQPRIFVKADPDFGVALSAALNKKHAPATVVLDENSAEYILQSAGVAAKQESGVGKIARCLFAYCIGIEV